MKNRVKFHFSNIKTIIVPINVILIFKRFQNRPTLVSEHVVVHVVFLYLRKLVNKKHVHFEQRRTVREMCTSQLSTKPFSANVTLVWCSVRIWGVIHTWKFANLHKSRRWKLLPSTAANAWRTAGWQRGRFRADQLLAQFINELKPYFFGSELISCHKMKEFRAAMPVELAIVCVRVFTSYYFFVLIVYWLVWMAFSYLGGRTVTFCN